MVEVDEADARVLRVVLGVEDLEMGGRARGKERTGRRFSTPVEIPICRGPDFDFTNA